MLDYREISPYVILKLIVWIDTKTIVYYYIFYLHQNSLVCKVTIIGRSQQRLTCYITQKYLHPHEHNYQCTCMPWPVCLIFSMIFQLFLNCFSFLCYVFLLLNFLSKFSIIFWLLCDPKLFPKVIFLSQLTYFPLFNHCLSHASHF